MPPFGLVIHGGAGDVRRDEISASLEEKFRRVLGETLAAGHALLAAGRPALDVVTETVALLEDCPLFNSGVGANLNADGECELDASVMDGRTLAAGAVAGVRTVRSPIRLARDVMGRSNHVLLAAAGAEEFARAIGHEAVANAFFQTPFRRAQWERVREMERHQADQPSGLESNLLTSFSADDNYLMRELKFGTVGCVALDQSGSLAAGTSTGGMLNKRFGRVGDSPLIGAGTYADDFACAVSCTGQGEYFVRVGVAKDVAARMIYGRDSLADAARGALVRVGELGGSGGLIAIDRAGHVALPFNTAGMYRAYRVGGAGPVVAIFGDEE